MRVIAHRGASAYAPENTIEAFRKAMAMGSNFFETDVQLTKDGFLVLSHDYDVNGKAVKDNLLSDLRLPLLDDLLGLLKPEAFLNIEIKNDGNIYPGIEQKVLDLLKKYPANLKEQIFISSFDFPTLQRVRALDASIKIGVLTRNFDIKEALSLNAASVNISKTRLTKEITQACHSHNIKVFVYTVNTKEEAAAAGALGADAVFSDFPDLLDKR